MLSSKKQSGVVDVFVCACVQSSAWADMLHFFLSLVKITFYTEKIIRCILRGIILLLLKIAVYVHLCLYCFSVPYFILMDIKWFSSWTSVRWWKSNIFFVLRVQKYSTFFSHIDMLSYLFQGKQEIHL